MTIITPHKKFSLQNHTFLFPIHRPVFFVLPKTVSISYTHFKVILEIGIKGWVHLSRGTVLQDGQLVALKEREYFWKF